MIDLNKPVASPLRPAQCMNPTCCSGGASCLHNPPDDDDYEEDTDHAPEYIYKWKAVASFAVAGLGAAAEYMSGGSTGIGWAMLGFIIIWH